MRAAALLFVLFLAGIVVAQDTVYVCPMDPDVRSSQPGFCPRCGMKLAAGLPEPAEYRIDLAVTPHLLRALQKVKLGFTVRDPWKGLPVTRFQSLHERLFHLFVVSQDLQFFAHVHPALHPGGTFTYETALPTPGMYRLLADFYPDGATPQLVAKTLIVPGAVPPVAALTRDYSPKDAENLHVELSTDPPQPIAGMKTLMFFRVSPADGFEPYLGAWGHMLAASSDLIDLMHTHPFLANGPLVQFNVEFPRAGTYRVWVQFQRKGVVNTARFDVPVTRLE
jgi:Heavy metal binding domain